jgi:hypothetical protein
MSHGFGDLPATSGDVTGTGASTARLIDNDGVFDRYSGQPQMSNIPACVVPLASDIV